jgi:chemotaxis protein MotB
MKLGNRPRGKHGNSERWLLTYSDLITLLMVFFIMMYAISNLNAEKYQQLSQSLSSYMGGGNKVFKVKEGNTGFAPSSQKQQLQGTSQQSDDALQKLLQLRSKVDSYLKKNGLSGRVDTEITQFGLEINLKDSVLFDSGDAAIKPGARGKLLHIGRLLNSLENPIRIEGYTDNVPINSSRFPSNWYLSAARAINVDEFLIKEIHIAPQRISIAGYGEYCPRVPNTTEENRKINRRVKLVLLKDN